MSLYLKWPILSLKELSTVKKAAQWQEHAVQHTQRSHTRLGYIVQNRFAYIGRIRWHCTARISPGHTGKARQIFGSEFSLLLLLCRRSPPCLPAVVAAEDRLRAPHSSRLSLPHVHAGHTDRYSMQIYKSSMRDRLCLGPSLIISMRGKRCYLAWKIRL